MSNQVLSWFQITLGVLGLILLALIFFSLVALVFVKKKKSSEKFKLSIEKINSTFEKNRDILYNEILTDKEKKNLENEKKEKLKQSKKSENKKQEELKKKIFVLDFKGDMQASEVDQFREHVTAIVQVARKIDEVVVRLESPGGLVHAYGLAASQMERLRSYGLNLTVCVDKVAASGGYMMACLAEKIVCSPFAIIGSIGVIANVPNFHKLLKKNNVDFYEVTAGEHKRTLTMLGEVNDKKLKKFEEQIEDIHSLFKDHVKDYRTMVDIDVVSSGEYWFGKRALELKLVDQLQTSDEYLLELSRSFDVYHIYTPKQVSMMNKIMSSFGSYIQNTLLRLI